MSESSIENSTSENYSSNKSTSVEEKIGKESVEPTSRQELLAWIIFDFASGVFPSVGMQVFIPLILDQLARNIGRVSGSIDTPCATGDPTTFSSTLSNCEISFGGSYVSTVSFVLYISSISVILQAITFISLGSLADYGSWRKKLLVLFSFLGSLSAIMFLVVVNPNLFWLAAVFSIFGNVCYGATTVFYNAYLAVLVRNHPCLLKLENGVTDPSSLKETDISLLGFSNFLEKIKRRLYGGWTVKSEPSSTHSEMANFSNQNIDSNDAALETIRLRTSIEDRLSNLLSTHGLASGYCANLIVLLISAAIIFSFPNTAYGMQIVVAVTGLWWIIFGSFTLIFLKTRPGPPFPSQKESCIIFSWKKTFYALNHCKRLPNTFLYLIAYFIFSDSFSTIGQIAILFARSNADMSNSQIAVAVVVAPVGALIGVYFWLWLSRTLHWTPKTILIILLTIGSLLPLYGLLGFIPFHDKINLTNNLNVGFGLSSSLEMYVAVIFFSSLFAPIISFSRVLFTNVVPNGHEAEFFALYEISDRGTSWIGPLVVGALADQNNGNLRYGFIYIIITILIPIIILWKWVDVSKAKTECETFLIEESSKVLNVEEVERKKNSSLRTKRNNALVVNIGMVGITEDKTEL